MGKIKSVLVRAQRKFAHKAHVPGPSDKNDVASSSGIVYHPPEPEPAPSPQSTISLNRKPIQELIDQVAFNNVHPHKEKKQNEPRPNNYKDVRVLLERISPSKASGSIASPPPPSPSPPCTPPFSPLLIEREFCNSSVRQCLTPIKGKNKRTPDVQKRANTQRSTTKSVQDPIKVMNLRNRVVRREWTTAESPMREKLRTKQNHVTTILSRRSSETILEDNIPLTYFVKKKVSNNNENNQQNAALVDSPRSEPHYGKSTNNGKKASGIGLNVKRKTISKKCAKKFASRSKLAKKIQIQTVKRVTRSSHQASVADNFVIESTSERDDDQNNKESNQDLFAVGPLVLTTEVDIVKNYSPSAETNESTNRNATSEVDQQEPHIAKRNVQQDPRPDPSNRIANFLTYIYDWNEDSDLDSAGIQHQMDECAELNYSLHSEDQQKSVDETEENGITRVQEWLENLTPRAQQSHTEFKVPETPRRKDNRRVVEQSPLSTAGSSRTIASAVPISLKERSLRRNCPSWNYTKIYSIVSTPELIARFCLECTRCKIMFKLRDSQESAFVPDETFSDVYEFDSERDEDPELKRKKQILMNISKDTSHMIKLKEILTYKGKKIMEAAIIMKERVNNPLLPRDKVILEQVISILIECNSARIEGVARPAQASIAQRNDNRKRIAQEQPSTSSNGRSSHYDSVLMPPQRKRPRQNLIPETPRTPIPMIEAELRDSRKFSLSYEECLMSPVTYAYNMLRRYPGMGLCGVKPPPDFKPQCHIMNTQINFKLCNQYIHRMLKRWGLATQELTAIRLTQEENSQRSPLFEGLELDLVKLYHTVQEEKGLEACQSNKEKWQVIAGKMNLPIRSKAAKLENIYLKYLLSYNTLSCEEREKAVTIVNNRWAEREQKTKLRLQRPLRRQDQLRDGHDLSEDEESSYLDKVCAEAEECISHGRYSNYTGYKKLAQRVMGSYFPDHENPPTPEEVEQDYWSKVISGASHVCVYAGHLDSAEHGMGFSSDRADEYMNHPWNLKRLCRSSTNLLSNLTPSTIALSVTAPTIQLGMVFTTSCWHMDPTSVPWIEYLHSGSPKIWYSVSPDQNEKLRSAVELICPFAVQNKDIWLPCDIVMIPPRMLRLHGVHVERHVQYPGEYVIVYPNTYSACIDTGFSVSEGLYFAPHSWLKNIDPIFQKLRINAEPSLFSMEELLISMARNENLNIDQMQVVYSLLSSTVQAEIGYRQILTKRNIELITPEVFLEQNSRASNTSWQITSGECYYCRGHLYLSKVVGLTEGQTNLCSRHGVYLFDHTVSRRTQITNVFCVLLFTNAQLNKLLSDLEKCMGQQAL